jgi:hypothetical protein
MRIRAYGVAWLRLQAESRRHVLIDFDGKAVNRVPSRRILKSSRTRRSTPLSRRNVIAATDSSAVVTRSSVPVSRVHQRRNRFGTRRVEVSRCRRSTPDPHRAVTVATNDPLPRNAAKPGEKRPILQESRLGTDVPFVAAPGPHRRGGTGAPPSPPRRGALRSRAVSRDHSGPGRSPGQTTSQNPASERKVA